MKALKLISLLLVSVGLLITIAPLNAQTGAELFQKAVTLERADGNLKAAIQVYLKIAKSDRALAPKALLRAADCSQRLGDQNAQALLEQVIREFPASAEAVEARTKLYLLPSAAPPPPARITIPEAYGEIFSDGKRVLYQEHHWRGALVIADLKGGNRKIVYQPKPSDFIESFYPSRDLGSVLLICHPPGEPGERLAVVRAINGQYKELAHMDERASFRPAWNRQGTAFVYLRLKRKGSTNDFDRHLVTISVPDGTERVLCTLTDPVLTGAWSPDGTAFAYITGALTGAYGPLRPSQAWLLRSDGSPAKFVTLVSARLIDWSPDGRYLVLSRMLQGELPRLALFPIDGTHIGLPRDLDSWEYSGVGYLSGTGGLIYMKAPETIAGNFYLAKPDAAGHIDNWRLISNAGGDRPGWSPDSQQIVYVPNALEEVGFSLSYKVWKNTIANDTSEFLTEFPGRSPPDCVWLSMLTVCEYFDTGGQSSFPNITRFLSPGSVDASLSLGGPLKDAIGCSTYCKGKIYSATDHELILGGQHYGGRSNEMKYQLIRFDLASKQSTMKLDWGEPLPVKISPNGRYAVDYKKDQSGTVSLAIRELTSGSTWKSIATLRTLFDLPAEGSVDVSPDSKMVFYEDDDSAGTPSLFRVSISGDTPPVRIGPYPTATKGRLVISPDGSSVLAVDPRAKRGQTWIIENFLPQIH